MKPIDRERQAKLLQAKPIEAALTLSLLWEHGDVLPKKEVQSVGAILSGSDRTKFEREPQFYARKILAQKRAKENAINKGWWIEGQSYCPDSEKFVIIEVTTQYDYAFGWLKKYGLGDEGLSEPVAMWERLTGRRVEDFLIAIYGDDRHGQEGQYFLVLGYSDPEIAEAFSPELPFAIL